MEFAQVSFTAYLCAATMAGLLALLYGRGWWQKALPSGLALAALLQGLNLGAIGLTFSDTGFPTHYLLFLECLHFAAWNLALRQLMARAGQHTLPTSLKVLFAAGWPLTALVLCAALLNLRALPLFGTWIALTLAVISLVCVEQVYRYASGHNRQNKLIVVSLGALFLFDVYIYSHAIIFQAFDPLLWQSRAAVSLGVCLFMGLGNLLLQNRSNAPAELSLSRPTAFYSTSLLAVGSLFMVLALGGYYVRIYSGNWGSVVYSLALIGAVLLLGSLLVSNHLRERLSVMLNKHLFRHKFDYRSEWLRLINFLSLPADSAEACQRAFLAATSIAKASGGALWIKTADRLVPVFQLAIKTREPLPAIAASETFVQTMQEQDWIFYPASSSASSRSKHNQQLPQWVQRIDDLWLLVPLNAGPELIGFVALCQAGKSALPTWEDFDLLKTTGRQLGSYLKLHLQSEQLAENRQFDTYNKLVAFIIHDLNNIIAQQTLVVKNAEKHKTNPAFVEDAIQTIDNSVERMRGLLKKLKRGESDLIQQVRLRDCVRAAIEECRNGRTSLTSDLGNSQRTLQADQVRLVMTISHFIKNALDATGEDGSIHVTMRVDGDNASITIEDNGCGMEQSFVQNRLFRPFDTTKSGKGMGIGAYLSREYIIELKGSLEVTSQPGKGTRVLFTLPLDHDAGSHNDQSTTGTVNQNEQING